MHLPRPVKKFWTFISTAFTKFIADGAFTWAAAISYYTIFSLPPMLLVILYTTTLFYDEQSMREAIFGQIGSLIGNNGANQFLVIMLWVFYASLIFLFGAVVTAIYVERYSTQGIQPADYAVKVKENEVEIKRNPTTEDKVVR